MTEKSVEKLTEETSELTQSEKARIQMRKQWSDPKFRERVIANMKGKKRTPEQCERMRLEQARRRKERLEGR